MEASLQIYTLGGVQVLRAGEPVSGLSTHKAEALLIYLASTRRPQPREVLAEFLWDERTQSQAMGNLRGVLTNLRQVLGDSLVITRDQAGINPEAEVWLDAFELENSLSAIRKQGRLNADTARQAESTLELYKGEFLQGFSVFDCRGFEDWSVRERERLHHLAVDGLSELVSFAIEQKDYQLGMTHAAQLLELDPLMESAHRQMMQLLAASGQRTAALSQYESCQKILKAELGVKPDAETRQLYEQIRTGETITKEEPDYLPKGTVTFLFSDGEGSITAEQRRILRECFASCNGHEMDAQGDALLVAFSRATQAVAAAAEAQRKLAEHAMPGGAGVRMGLHTGEPWNVSDNHTSIDVQRAARLARAGHAGQVLLSETTATLVQDELPQGVTIADLGRYLLKDIHRPEHIYQLVIEGLPSEFLPLTSVEVVPPESARVPRKVGTCPYRGLSAFQEQDAQFYFGREAFVEALEQAVSSKKLVAVIVGSSGSGKSSALFAGLLPRLRKAGGYLLAALRPGTQPFYSLAGALLPLLEPKLSETDRLTETRKLAEVFTNGEVHLAEVARRILEKTPSTRQVLLVVDQFEELYTLCPDTQLQKAFIDELLATVEAAKNRKTGLAVILLTMRADFMGQALAHRPFADALQEASVLMGPMNRQELHMAIEKPAEMQGAVFEPGLVERILDDVGDKPGNLPLLEFTLTQLWEQQTDGWLTHANYENMGCLEGALASYADQVYADLDESEQEHTRSALVQLVQPGEGTEDTRRIATREELGDESWKLIQKLADKRLVVTGRDAQGSETAEVVHEALIQKWERFQEWMDTDRTFRAWQERLRGSLRQWQESGQDEGALLAGAPLAVAQGWLNERGGELTLAETGYIQASQALQLRQHKERQRRRQWAFMGISAGLVVALILSLVTFQQRQAARRQAGILLASQAESELGSGNADRAILLALAALENYPYTAQAEHALGQAVTYNRALALYEGHGAAITSAAWSSDGRRIATSSNDNSVHIWDPATGEPIRHINLPEGITGNIYDWALSVKWSPDDRYLLTISGDRFLTGSQDFDLILWNVETGEQVTAQEVHNTIPPSTGKLGTTSQLRFMTGAGAAFSRDGRLATLGGDNTALVWGPTLGDQQLVLSGHSEGVNAVAWSPDYTRLATASEDGTARIWDAGSGQELIQLVGHSGGINQVAWSPDGILLATAGKDGSVWFWDGMSGEKLSSIQIATASGSSQASDLIVWSITWSPDGKSLATGSGDGYIRVWDVDSGENTIELKGHDQYVTFLDWSPLDDRLVSAAADGKARVWNIARDNTVLSLPYNSYTMAEWSPDGEHIAVGTGADMEKKYVGLVAIWDFKSGQPLFETHADKDENWGWGPMIYSPDGRYLLARTQLKWPDTTDANKYYLFDSQSGEIVRIYETGKDTLLLVPGISPDGKLLAGGDFEGTIYFWDMDSGELVRTLNCLSWGHVVRWSPDGSKIAILCFDYEENVSAIQVLDAKTYKPLITIESDVTEDALEWISWSPDNTRIAVAGGNDESGTLVNPVYIFDASSGEELLKIVRHTGMVWAAHWSPDGKRLVSGSTDDTVRVWDSETGAELLTLSTPNDWAAYPLWSPDGQYLLVAIGNMSTSGRADVWRVWQSTQELIDYAKECCVFRDLTEAERTQFGLP
jgi:WD40 repeat protein/DNA-binding SARP family transcriptional activator